MDVYDQWKIVTYKLSYPRSHHFHILFSLYFAHLHDEDTWFTSQLLYERLYSKDPGRKNVKFKGALDNLVALNILEKRAKKPVKKVGRSTKSRKSGRPPDEYRMKPHFIQIIKNNDPSKHKFLGNLTKRISVVDNILEIMEQDLGEINVLKDNEDLVKTVISIVDNYTLYLSVKVIEKWRESNGMMMLQ